MPHTSLSDSAFISISMCAGEPRIIENVYDPINYTVIKLEDAGHNNASNHYPATP